MKITSHYKFHEGFNDLPTKSVPFGFQQLIHTNHNQYLPPNLTETQSTHLEFCVYPLLTKILLQFLLYPMIQIVNLVSSYMMMNFILYGHLYIDKIREKFNMEKAFNNL